MAESKASSWLTAVSAFVGVAAVVFAVYQHLQKESEKEIVQWQRVLIYKIISEKNGATFQDLKTRYLQEATQLQSFKLPPREIQDDALRLNLLELQKDRLIILGVNGIYRAVVDIPDVQRDLMISFAKSEIERKDAFYLRRPAILRLIERESGRYTSEELHQRVREEKIDVSIEDFYNIVSSLRVERFINRDSRGKLWLTHDIEAPEEREPAPKRKR